MNSGTTRRHDSLARGFTLIELLVVIAVISVLMAILVPALHKVRFHAHETACGVNVSYLDGHVGRVYKSPKDSYR
jgi:prepilin-type N-terminal cleavage/methylation domain-containing protein/prepilin-type processing-associated H-X9-DG protein